MKVVITNTTMANGGDAAIALSIIDMLRLAFGNDVDVTVVDSMADVSARYYPHLRIRQSLGFSAPKGANGFARRVQGLGRRVDQRRLRAYLNLKRRARESLDFVLTAEQRNTLRCYEEADLVVSSGGTYLVDHYDISPRLLEFEAILALGKPLILYTQSLGPFQRPAMRENLKPVFDQSSLILLRDGRSQKLLAQMGVAPSKLHVLADAVFGLARPETLRKAGATSSEIRKVAISVRNWSHFQQQNSGLGMQRYLDGMAASAASLIRERDCELTFLSTCQGIPEYPHKDSLVAEEIAGRMPADLRHRARVDHGFHDPYQLLEMLERFDLVIATRMHMGILALCAGVPVLPIAYEFKTEELFDRFGLAQWVTRIEDVNETRFPATVTQFVSSLPDIRSRMFAAAERERQSALLARALVSATMAAPVPVHRGAAAR